jgi:hypothetical protein
VLYGPWRFQPRPYWLVDNTATSGDLVPAVFRFAIAAADHSLLRQLWWLTAAAMAAMQG